MGARGLGQVAQAEDRSPVPWRGGTAVHPGSEPEGAFHCQGSWCGQGFGGSPRTVAEQFEQQGRGKESSTSSQPCAGAASSDILLPFIHRDDLPGPSLDLQYLESRWQH